MEEKQKEFFNKLSRLQPPDHKPTHFHSKCILLPVHLQQGRGGSSEQKDLDDEMIGSPDDNENLANHDIFEIPKTNRYHNDKSYIDYNKLKQGYANTACLSNMVCNKQIWHNGLSIIYTDCYTMHPSL